MFLVHPTLSETDMDDVADGVQKVLTVATQA
jgi:ribosomal protein S6